MYRVKTNKVTVFIKTPEKETYSIKDVAMKKNIKQFEVKRLLGLIFPDLEINTKLKIPLSLINFMQEQHINDTVQITQKPVDNIELFKKLEATGYNNKQKVEITKLINSGKIFEMEKFPKTMHWVQMKELRMAGKIDKYYLSDYMQKKYLRYLKKRKIPGIKIIIPLEEVANAKYKSI
ncbi:MAG: hypothetical protein ACRC5R_03060 [Mycoplasmatales bacterium]